MRRPAPPPAGASERRGEPLRFGSLGSRRAACAGSPLGLAANDNVLPSNHHPDNGPGNLDLARHQAGGVAPSNLFGCRARRAACETSLGICSGQRSEIGCPPRTSARDDALGQQDRHGTAENCDHSKCQGQNRACSAIGPFKAFRPFDAMAATRARSREAMSGRCRGRGLLASFGSRHSRARVPARQEAASSRTDAVASATMPPATASGPGIGWRALTLAVDPSTSIIMTVASPAIRLATALAVSGDSPRAISLAAPRTASSTCNCMMPALRAVSSTPRRATTTRIPTANSAVTAPAEMTSLAGSRSSAELPAPANSGAAAELRAPANSGAAAELRAPTNSGAAAELREAADLRALTALRAGGDGFPSAASPPPLKLSGLTEWRGPLE